MPETKTRKLATEIIEERGTGHEPGFLERRAHDVASRMKLELEKMDYEVEMEKRRQEMEKLRAAQAQPLASAGGVNQSAMTVAYNLLADPKLKEQFLSLPPTQFGPSLLPPRGEGQPLPPRF